MVSVCFFYLRWGGRECTPPPLTTRQMILSWRPRLKHCLCFYPLLWQQWQLSINTWTWWTIYIHSFHLFMGRENTHLHIYIYILASMTWQFEQCTVMRTVELDFYFFIFLCLGLQKANSSQSYISRQPSKSHLFFCFFNTDTFTGRESSHFLTSNPGIVLTPCHKSALCLQKTSSSEGVKTFPLTDGGCVYSELLQHIKCHPGWIFMSTWAELLLVSTCAAKWIQNMQMHLDTQV